MLYTKMNAEVLQTPALTFRRRGYTVVGGAA